MPHNHPPRHAANVTRNGGRRDDSGNPTPPVTPKKKSRLDVALAERGLAPSRQRAQALVMAGSVQVNERRVDKPGHRVGDEDRIEVHGEPRRYASRGGLKLEAALEGYRLDVAGLVCLDVGASTGGFTDCLLQHGAARVYAVDVGYGQLAWTLRQDARVVVIERANIRHLSPDAVAEAVDLITIDASFISLRIVVPAALKFLKGSGRVLALIKPQFEVGKGQVGKGGVVSDPLQHAQTLTELDRFFTGLGLACSAPLPSPILGPKGNREFFMLMGASRTHI